MGEKTELLKLYDSAFHIGKAKVTIRNYINQDEVLLDDEFKFIAPRDDCDKFLTYILSKRFLQVESLVRTSPRNVLKKLTKLGEFVIKMEISSEPTYIISGMNGEKTIYEWITNSGVPIFLIPWDGRLFVLFTTENGNKYCVVINKKFIAYDF